MARIRRFKTWVVPSAVVGALAWSFATVLADSAVAADSSTPVDVLFVFDVTGSMGGALDEAKTQVADAIGSVRETYPDSRFAAAAVADYGRDTPWRLAQEMTTDAAAVQSALAPLTAGGGGDSPEAYGRALYEASNSGEIGWRASARRILILVNDDVPHDNDLNEGVPAAIQNQGSPWDTGRDAGRDGVVGTSDDVDWQAALAELKTKGIVFATVLYSGSSTYLPYWDWWTKLTGGSTSAGGGATSLGDILAKLVDEGVAAGGLDAGDPAAWAAGDVHVHAAGDASLNDNIVCRKANKIPARGKPTDAQKADCAAFLVDKVLDTARANGMQWVVLSEHGVWLGVDALGANSGNIFYSEPEARHQWREIRDRASAAAPGKSVRALMGEEIGSAAPLTSSGHFSTYYARDYIANNQYEKSEGKFLNKVKEPGGGWGAINHPGTGSTWGCWFDTDGKIKVRGQVIHDSCPDSVAADHPGEVKALEVYTSEEQPINDVLRRWDGMLARGVKVAAVGGGDTHTASRCGAGKVVWGSCGPSWRALRQVEGNSDEIGHDGRARTYVLAESVKPAPGFDSNASDDPVRGAIANGRTLSSNGPVVGVTVDGRGPDASAVVPWSSSGHKIEVTWNPAQVKAEGATGTYGRPSKIRLVLGQVVDPALRGDCGSARSPYRHEDCTKTIDIPLGSPTTTMGSNQRLSFTLKNSDLWNYRTSRPTSTLDYTPATFARLEIEFKGKRGVYTSPFYLQGRTLEIPKF